jgi:hypothetical protein
MSKTEKELVSTEYEDIEEVSNPSQASELSQGDLQQQLDTHVARFSAAITQEGLHETVLIRGLQFELV